MVLLFWVATLHPPPCHVLSHPVAQRALMAAALLHSAMLSGASLHASIPPPSPSPHHSPPPHQAPDRMHNAHKGLVLFFVGAGLNPVNQVHIPGSDEIFIRLAAPYVPSTALHCPPLPAHCPPTALHCPPTALPLPAHCPPLPAHCPPTARPLPSTARPLPTHCPPTAPTHPLLASLCVLSTLSVPPPVSVSLHVSRLQQLSASTSPLPFSPPLGLRYPFPPMQRACSMVVDLGILEMMLQQVPMMPISFKVGPPGIGPRADLIEEEITARECKMNECEMNECKMNECEMNECKMNECKMNECEMNECEMTNTIAMFLDHPDEWEWLTPLPMAKSIIRALDATQLASIIRALDATQIAVRDLLPHVPVSRCLHTYVCQYLNHYLASLSPPCMLQVASVGVRPSHFTPLPAHGQVHHLCLRFAAARAGEIVCASGKDGVLSAAAAAAAHVLVEGFVSIGVSKRAGMSYFAAALDKRVVAFITYGYDVLNVVPNLQHMHDSLGGWPILLKFNSEYNISQRLHSHHYRKMAEAIDPYTLIDRMDMPKLLISASNDEFFLIDDSYYFLKDMPQPTQLKIVPNLYHMVIQNSFWACNACLSFFSSLLRLFHRLPPPHLLFPLLSLLPPSHLPPTIRHTTQVSPSPLSSKSIPPVPLSPPPPALPSPGLDPTPPPLLPLPPPHLHPL
ncbi:unnamed protein product [Closterium sp. Naga37s-1]|nr:unnamed protein product [Closterium sp. Naga37s-1]